MNKKGYTLIEVLIALSVFAIMATLTGAVMYQVFNTKSRIAEKANALNDIQLAIARVEQDTRQFLPRPIRSKDAQIEQSFTGQHQYVEFTRGGIENPMSLEKESSLMRVAYVCDHNKLIRRSWQMLDSPERNTYKDNLVLEHLKACSFDYMTSFNQLLPDWRTFKLEDKRKIAATPKAIQLTIDPYGWGEMKQIFILTEGLYAPR